MENGGGLELDQILDDIKLQIVEYYGQLNEVKAGIRSTMDPKPEMLVIYETLNRFDMPLVEGSYMDQPTIWLAQYEMIDQTVTMLEAIAKPPPKEDNPK